MQVTDTIHIDMSRELVWAVIEDIERWPEWTPTMTSVRLVGEPPLRVGRVARIKLPMQSEAEWVITDFVRGSRFVLADSAQRPADDRYAPDLAGRRWHPECASC